MRTVEGKEEVKTTNKTVDDLKARTDALENSFRAVRLDLHNSQQVSDQTT